MPTVVECDACGNAMAESNVARSHWTLIELDDGREVEEQLHFCASCVRQEDRELLLDACRDALKVLEQELHESRMFRNVWRRANEALGWLYMLDLFHFVQKETRPSYLSLRQENAGACALAGLVWARGKAVHVMWQFEATGAKPTSTGFARVDVIRAGTTVWAPFDGDKKEAGAECYAEHVAGRPLLEPMREALRFLEGLDETY